MLDSVRDGRGRSVSLEDSARIDLPLAVRGPGRDARRRASPRSTTCSPGEWSGSYPETTGYIIPTFLAYAEAFDAPEARERALRMADWETSIQMEDGAVLSGALGTERGPAVFNTGQGLFGWVAAFEATGDERYATAGAPRRATGSSTTWTTTARGGATCP